MLDTTSPLPPDRHQRVKGRAMVQIAATGLRDLHQSGSAKAMLPRVHGPVPEVVFLNTAGGLTGGDDLRFQLDVGAGAHVAATTQTAERAYASTGSAADVDVTMTVGAGGRLDWLPQETILFNHAHLNRRTTIDLAGDAALLTCEALVLGRAAMGEVVTDLTLRDTRHFTRDGAPVVFDPYGLDAASLARASGPVVLGGARATAVVWMVMQGAEDAVDPARRVLDAHPEIRGAVSGWDGRLCARLTAADGWPLRRALARLLEHLRGGPLPRVWQI